MKDAKDITACVVDSGLFLPMAIRLAEDYKRVLYWSPDMRSFPSLKQGVIGDGFQNIERVREFWPEHNEIDLWVFPDIGQPGLQKHLVDDGHAVWGSGCGEILETNREKFMKVLGEVGLDVPDFKVCIGIDALTDHLRENEDQYVKISRWRGDMETTHWRNWAMDSGWIDWLAYTLGPLKNHMRFLVFPAIDTTLEIGADTYCVDGRWPNTMLNGLEHKDTTYFSAVTKREDMPEQIQDVLEAFGPFLGARRYRNQWSMEVRVKDGKAYFIDATCRGGMPSSASQQILWGNFPEIVWAGANGELVEPEPQSQFSIECMVTTKTGKDCWDRIELPKSLEGWVRFSNCAFIDGCYVFPPDEFHSGELGWLCAIGDTPRQTLDAAKGLADQLPDGLDANLENLTGLIKEIEEAEKRDIPFTDEQLPMPAEVIEP